MYSLHEQILLLFSTPFYIIIIVAEILLSNIKLKRNVYTLRNTAENIFLSIANSVVDFCCKIFYLAALVFVFHHSPFQQWHTGFWYWILLLLGVDFVFYWQHRFEHEIRFLWAVHITHHSSAHFNFGVGFRSSVFSPLYRFIYFIPLAWLGFQPLDILFMYSATQIWGTLVHTELVGKLGWLEYLFITPSHHRVHHAANPKYLDKNMGMFLIVWDKMFGTFQEELSENEYAPIRFGLTKNQANPNFADLIFYEWKQIFTDIRRKDISLQQKIKYIFGPPGYSHDGSRKTSKELVEEELRNDN